MTARSAAVLIVAGVLVAVTGCGGSGHRAPRRAPSGASLFASAGCGSCHTLAAAHTDGSVGPDLDRLAPSEAVVRRQVTRGGGGMPSFGGELSSADIAAIARYVATVTHRSTGTREDR